MTASARDSLPTAYVPPHWEGATRAFSNRAKEPTFLVHASTRKQGNWITGSNFARILPTASAS